MAQAEASLPDVAIEPNDQAPVKMIKAEELAQLGQNLQQLFTQYASDRVVLELKWTRNLRQYLGIYDPDIQKDIDASKRSSAYPRITRVKCISVLSRIMNLMFPGNERNWAVKASPSADMSPADVMEAIQADQKRQQEAGVQMEMTDEAVQLAVQRLADERAKALSVVIDDQLQEIGGDQTLDYIALNRKVAASGILFGAGLLRGPFVRTSKRTKWVIGMDGQPSPQEVPLYKPMYEFLPVWDFYPDLSAKTFETMDGWFSRFVMSKSQLRALANREDFLSDMIKQVIARMPTGNYKPRTFETDLRTMGVKVNVNEQKADTGKYEVIVWHGPITASQLVAAGATVPPEKMADDIEAEVWTVDGQVIKAEMNPWRKIGADVKTIHAFLFDEDDTSPIGNGLPNVVRDSQMSIAATTRMLLDNASIVCGPNLEVNTALLRADQDYSSVSAYKIWYRDDNGGDAMAPAVRNIQIDSHIDELLKAIDLFMKFADMETFVGAATGGDMQKGPSEPLRTAAGASMLRGDAALPFKDIVRNFDSFTQSVILSLVEFNKKFNMDRVKAGDYNVIARGATSLIAKELRGIQIDSLATTMTPAEQLHVDERKLVEARFAVRDLDDMLLPMDEVNRRQAKQSEQQLAQQQKQDELIEANIRKLLSDAFKNIAQGQKNSATADAAVVKSALEILERGLNGPDGQEGEAGGAVKTAA